MPSNWGRPGSTGRLTSGGLADPADTRSARRCNPASAMDTAHVRAMSSGPPQSTMDHGGPLLSDDSDAAADSGGGQGQSSIHRSKWSGVGPPWYSCQAELQRAARGSTKSTGLPPRLLVLTVRSGLATPPGSRSRSGCRRHSTPTGRAANDPRRSASAPVRPVPGRPASAPTPQNERRAGGAHCPPDRPYHLVELPAPVASTR